MSWLLTPIRASWQQPEQALSVQLRIHWVWKPGECWGYELFEVSAKAKSETYTISGFMFVSKPLLYPLPPQTLIVRSNTTEGHRKPDSMNTCLLAYSEPFLIRIDAGYHPFLRPTKPVLSN